MRNAYAILMGKRRRHRCKWENNTNMNLEFEKLPLQTKRFDIDMCIRYRYNITEETVSNGNVFVSRIPKAPGWKLGRDNSYLD